MVNTGKGFDCDKFRNDQFPNLHHLPYRKLMESDMRSVRMKTNQKGNADENRARNGCHILRKNMWSKLCKTVSPIFLCFAVFAGSQVLEVDLAACAFLQCQSSVKELKCRQEPRSAELGYRRIIAQTAFTHMLYSAGMI